MSEVDNVDNNLLKPTDTVLTGDEEEIEGSYSSLDEEEVTELPESPSSISAITRARRRAALEAARRRGRMSTILTDTL